MVSKIKIFLLLVVLSMTMAPSCEKRLPVSDSTDIIPIELRSEEKEMVLADQTFAFEFFEQIFKEESAGDNNNFMVSPLSLSMALSMTANGAEGATKEKMLQTMRLDKFSDEERNGFYRKLKDGLLKTDPSVKLAIANSIFANKSIALKHDFINANRSFYNATVELLDFSRNESVEIINRWAADNTVGLIREVLDRVDANDLIYLLNAIYFKGIWNSEFDKEDTVEKPFTREDGTIQNVRMMWQNKTFNYAADENLQLVQLPYGNESFSMMVLLPAEGKKLEDVVSRILEEGYWTELKSVLRKAEVDLSFPKFKTEYSKKLNDVLTNMGMGISFTNDADFSSMSDAAARINLVKQDTYISTDEAGTEASAVTSVGIMLTSMPISPDKVVFNANRPFLYIIQENSTGAILFMGVVKKIDE